MSIIYGAFCIAIGITLAIHFLVRVKNEKLEPSTTPPWLLMGAAYFGTLLSMAITNTITPLNVYMFQTLTTVGLLWFARKLEFRFFFVSRQLTIGLGLFVSGWTLMSYLSNQDMFSTLLPGIIVFILTTFVVAVYFYIRSDEEVLLKNVLGGLFTVYGLAKILYIIDTRTDSVMFFVGLFVLDFLIYMITSFLLFFNNHYKKKPTSTIVTLPL